MRRDWTSLVVLSACVMGLLPHLMACQTCTSDFQCGPGKKCLMDPVTEVRSCGTPCTGDDECGGADKGLICVDGACERSPPVITLLQPSTDLALSEGTQSVGTVSGTVAFWGAKAKVRAVVRMSGSETCFSGVWEYPRSMEITNLEGTEDEPAWSGEMPFTFDDMPVVPGEGKVTAEVTVDGEKTVVTRDVSVSNCTSCPTITITTPASNTSLQADSLAAEGISGTTTVTGATCARWKIISENLEASEGVMNVVNGAFGPLKLPQFPGVNRVRIEVDGPASTVVSCEITMKANPETAVAMRAMLSWDSSGDMDLHMVKPGGTYAGFGDGSNSNDCHYANCRGSIKWGTGSVNLDVDNVTAYGPENIRVSKLEAGTYGIMINPFSKSATNMTVRVYLQRQLVGTVGPCKSPGKQEWAVGVVQVSSDGSQTFTSINQLVSGVPTTTPERWLDSSNPFGAGLTAIACPPPTSTLTCSGN